MSSEASEAYKTHLATLLSQVSQRKRFVLGGYQSATLRTLRQQTLRQEPRSDENLIQSRSNSCSIELYTLWTGEVTRCKLKQMTREHKVITIRPCPVYIDMNSTSQLQVEPSSSTNHGRGHHNRHHRHHRHHIDTISTQHRQDRLSSPP